MIKPLRVFILLILCISAQIHSCGQGGTWVWVKGSKDSIRVPPTFGTQGVPDINNTPGALVGAANWIDKDGNFWLFGGGMDTMVTNGPAGKSYSDLWKYEPTHNTWTWVKGPGVPNPRTVYGTKGVPDAANLPGGIMGGAVGYSTWTDNDNNFWLYDIRTNCLWRYQPGNNNWTWMNGNNDIYHRQPVYGIFNVPDANNSPGLRFGASSFWVDADNNLWLYGGQGGPPDSVYNDVWRYNIGTNEWTWMSGPQGFGHYAGYYGQLGVESPLNLPPTRYFFASWADGAGNFYLYGGINFATAIYNDIWRYNTLTNNWTWVGGDSTPNSTGSYNQYCEEGGNNMPQRRWNANLGTGAAKCMDFFYAFGGEGIMFNYFDDLWAFYPATAKWKWLSGSSQPNLLGNYGVQGVPAASNQIPGRYGQCQWVDASGALWVYGGIIFDTTGMSHIRYYDTQTKNDLWKFIPDTSCVHVTCYTPPAADSTYIDIYIPNAFSPNGDGVNDRFTIFSKNPLSTYAIKIFNRWGELVYESNNLSELNDTSQGWDGAYKGKLQDPGVFTYEIMAKDLSGAPIHKKGGVTLVR